MSFRMALAGLVALVLGVQQAAMAEDRDVAPLSKLMPFAADFLGLPQEQRNRIDLVYSFRVDVPEGTPVDFWVMDGQTRVDLSVDADGRVDWRALGDLLDADPDVWTNVPKGKGAVDVSVEPDLPVGQRLAASEVRAAIDQANKVLKKQAGLLSFAAPKVKSVGFQLPAGATAQAEMAGGVRKVLEPNDTGGVIVTSKALKKMERIVFSAEPERDWFGM